MAGEHLAVLAEPDLALVRAEGVLAGAGRSPNSRKNGRKKNATKMTMDGSEERAAARLPSHGAHRCGLRPHRPRPRAGAVVAVSTDSTTLVGASLDVVGTALT